MGHSRKRRLSMSPVRTRHPSEHQEHKKRKHNPVASTSASVKPSSSARPKPSSPGPVASDSSATLDGDAPTYKDKGKAVEKDPLVLELERLRTEVAHKTELLENREKTFAAVTQALTCQICLEILKKPYALPCGHVSCHSCLVSWFTAPDSNNTAGDEDNPDLDWYSNADSDASEQPVFDDEDAPPQNNSHPSPAANDSASTLPPTPAPARNGYPNSIRRRKTCPHCRCVLNDRPVQLYLLKDLVGIMESPDGKQKESAAKKATDNRDPWIGIFPPVKRPGGGSGFGHFPIAWRDDDAWSAEEVIDGPSRVNHANSAEQGSSSHPEGLANHHVFPFEPIVDDEDGVRRCVVCLHEIWHGECTECGLTYDVSDTSSDGDFVSGGGAQVLEGDNGVIATWPGFGDVSDVSEDDYESSFIDDEEHRGRTLRRSEIYHNEAGSEDDFVPGPSRRIMLETSVVSSDYGEDPGPSTRSQRRRARQIVDEDEEEERRVEGDIESAADGDEPFFLTDTQQDYDSSAAGSVDHSVSVIEDDDENYTGVPYVWEEDEEDEEENNDNDSSIVYFAH